jgi:hypothetical protein
MEFESGDRFVPKREELMERSSRMWLAAATAICSVLATISWAVAVYTFTNTPQIHDVVVRAANGGQSTQSKTIFLFAPTFFATFICLMLLNPLARWKRLIEKAAERAAPKELWAESTIGRFRFPTVLNAIILALCAASGMSLYWTVVRAGHLLNP